MNQAPAPSLSSSESTLLTDDGVRLSARWFSAADPMLTVLIGNAVGVPQRYYARFAGYLASRGIQTLSFDYRGIGASRSAAERSTITMRDWAEHDLTAAIAIAHQQAAETGTKLGMVTHSFGGQALGLARNNSLVDALTGISSQSGHWRNWDGLHRYRMWATMHLALPLAAKVFGDVPGWLLGGDGMPGPAAREWARWCRGPHYICHPDGSADREGFERWTGTARLHHIADDPMYGPPRAVEELASFYRNASVEVVHRRPQDWGVDQIGHFGFFRPAARAGWAELADWLTDTLT